MASLSQCRDAAGPRGYLCSSRRARCRFFGCSVESAGGVREKEESPPEQELQETTPLHQEEARSPGATAAQGRVAEARCEAETAKASQAAGASLGAPAGPSRGTIGRAPG